MPDPPRPAPNRQELPKLPEKPDGTGSWDWLEFMKTEDEEELDRLSARNPEVGKAVTRLKELSADEKTCALREAYDKARRDWLSIETSARREGLEEGLEKDWEKGRGNGRKEERLAIARNLFQLGLPGEKIMEATGLTQEEIQALQVWDNSPLHRPASPKLKSHLVMAKRVSPRQSPLPVIARREAIWQSMQRFSLPGRQSKPQGRLDCYGPEGLAMTEFLPL